MTALIFSTTLYIIIYVNRPSIYLTRFSTSEQMRRVSYGFLSDERKSIEKKKVDI